MRIRYRTDIGWQEWTSAVFAMVLTAMAAWLILSR